MKISPSTPSNIVVAKTKDKKDSKEVYKWWEVKDDQMCGSQLLSTAAFLKETQQYRMRQTAIYAKLYGNMSLFNFAGANMTKLDNTNGLPSDRPTFNLIQSVIDTIVARIGQNKPSPVFLTDNGDYKERRLAKQLNNFMQGEFYQTKSYAKAVMMLRDAEIIGTGVLHVYATDDDKVGVERVMPTELFIDPNEAMYGEPRQIYRLKLVDRKVLEAQSPKFKKTIELAATAYPDNSADSSKTVADLVMVVEGWHLRSGKDAKDGRHTIACSSGIIFDEEYEKDRFPFVFLHDSPRLLGFWAQGTAEQLTGTQMEINSLLATITKAIKLVGVPRIFVEDGSKVVKAHFNNDVGAIITWRGTKPEYSVAPCVPQEMYAQLQRLIDYGYQQRGVSAMQASAQKPAGLNSGEAIRSYDDISTDRMATLSKQYDDMFIDLAYLIIDKAMDIAKETGTYQTVYPNKNGAKQIDLPEMSLLKDPFIIQVFNQSSLPKEPAGRMQKITEMVQAGMISIKEGRRLLDYPDLDQVETLANASEERIFQTLDKIVEDGIYTPPDPFMDISLANDITVQYYNLYAASKLEEDRCQMLRDFFSQVQALKAEAQQAMAPPAAGNAPQAQAQAQPLPQSPLVPNSVPQGS